MKLIIDLMNQHFPCGILNFYMEFGQTYTAGSDITIDAKLVDFSGLEFGYDDLSSEFIGKASETDITIKTTAQDYNTILDYAKNSGLISIKFVKYRTSYGMVEDLIWQGNLDVETIVASLIHRTIKFSFCDNFGVLNDKFMNTNTDQITIMNNLLAVSSYGIENQNYQVVGYSLKQILDRLSGYSSIPYINVKYSNRLGQYIESRSEENGLNRFAGAHKYPFFESNYESNWQMAGLKKIIKGLANTFCCYLISGYGGRVYLMPYYLTGLEPVTTLDPKRFMDDPETGVIKRNNFMKVNFYNIADRAAGGTWKIEYYTDNGVVTKEPNIQDAKSFEIDIPFNDKGNTNSILAGGEVVSTSLGWIFDITPGHDRVKTESILKSRIKFYSNGYFTEDSDLYSLVTDIFWKVGNKNKLAYKLKIPGIYQRNTTPGTPIVDTRNVIYFEDKFWRIRRLKYDFVKDITELSLIEHTITQQ